MVFHGFYEQHKILLKPPLSQALSNNVFLVFCNFFNGHIYIYIYIYISLGPSQAGPFHET